MTSRALPRSGEARPRSGEMSRASPRSWIWSLDRPAVPMRSQKVWAEEETRSLSQAKCARAQAHTLQLGCLRRRDSAGRRNHYPAWGAACGGT
eukprot:3651333-Pleurochrysis_carterae.AAC.1